MAIPNKLLYDDFVPYAPAEPGTTHKHHCKQGRNNDRLYITRQEDGTILAYCHHCGSSGHYSVLGARVIKAAKTTEESNDPDIDKRDELSKSGSGNDGQGDGQAVSNGAGRATGVQSGFVPKGSCEIDVRAWPVHVQKWWFEYGLTITQAADARAGYYSDDACLEYNHLGGFQYRFFSNPGKKYYTIPDLDELGRSQYQEVETFMSVKTREGDTPLVLCEDFRSAVKLSNYCTTIAIGGVYPSAEFISALVLLRDPVQFPAIIVWLDNDNTEVIKQSKGLTNRLAALGYNVSRVPEDTHILDPKEYDWENIYRTLIRHAERL